MKRHFMPVLVVAALAISALSACSASVDLGSQTVSKDELASQVTAAIADTMKVDVEQVPTVTCPDDLDAEVGAATTCVLHDEDAGKNYDVAIKVTSIDGGQANFQLEIAPTPQPSSLQ